MAHARKIQNQAVPKKDTNVFKPPFRPERKTTMHDLLLRELQSVYYREKAVARVFPKIIKNACNYELIEAIHIHQSDTANQLLRLEKIFELLNETPLMTHCAAIDAMIAELEEMMEITKFGLLRDAGMILCLHKIEHYEIACYEMLSLYTEIHKQEEMVTLLERSLNEEKVAQMRLNKIAFSLRLDSPDSQR